MSLDLKALRTLAAQATPGPWRVGDGSFSSENLIANVRGVEVWGPYRATACGKEATYIAACSPTTVLALLDTLEQTQEDLTQVRVQLAGCSVIACGHDEPDVKQGVFGWSVAYEDIRKLRDTIERLREALKDIDALGCNCSNLPLSGVQHFPRCPRYIIREVFAAISQDEASPHA